MNKSIYDEALEIVDESLYQPDDSVIFNHLGLNLLKKALEQAIKQEELLNLYREKEKHEQEFPALNNIEYEDYQRIKTKIKELENAK